MERTFHFNNLLTVTSNCADFVVKDLPAPYLVRDHLPAIRAAGDRAERLTHQLLAFSRKQVRQPRLLDLNDVVGGIAPMLRRLIGENVELVIALTPTPTLPAILTDRGQLEQVVVNLAVDARDAMPNGGKLTIETSTCFTCRGTSRTRSCITACWIPASPSSGNPSPRRG